MLLLEDAGDFTLWHDPTSACLYATWHGYHAPSLTQAQYRLIRHQRQRTQSTKLLHDSLLDEDGWSALTRWLADDYFQGLAAEGLQALAWVLPRHPTALFDTAQVVARLPRPLVNTFTEAQTAYDWLHRWPTIPPQVLPTEPPLTPMAFLLLPPPQQLALARQQGRTLVPRWEVDYYVARYQVRDALVVEAYYHVHSGSLYQVQVQVLGG